MNTVELVRHMCDGRNSLSQIVDLLVDCGHDRQTILDEWVRLMESGDFSMRLIRMPYTLTNGEEAGLDVPVLVPKKGK